MLIIDSNQKSLITFSSISPQLYYPSNEGAINPINKAIKVKIIAIIGNSKMRTPLRNAMATDNKPSQLAIIYVANKDPIIIMIGNSQKKIPNSGYNAFDKDENILRISVSGFTPTAIQSPFINPKPTTNS